MRKAVHENRIDSPPFVFAPACPDCESKMRLNTIDHFRGAEIRVYRCSCGVTFSQTFRWEGANDGEALVVTEVRPA
jgi:hypothetical protein